MPSHEQNYETWNSFYDWSRYGGDEWSAKWGGTDMQWYWSILPRIRRFLPVETILDLGPGYGRWARYLREYCSRMVLVDLSEKCIHACKQKFGTENISYRVGDGQSLGPIQDRSVDFVFSWETLVYCEQPAVESYLRDLKKVLKDTGTAFLHHSNLASYSSYFQWTLKVPKAWRDRLKKRGLLDFDQWRARTVTAESFKSAAEACGLYVHTQELVPWGGKRLIDCFTTLSAQPPERPFKRLENPDLHNRAYHIQRLSRLYGEGVPW